MPSGWKKARRCHSGASERRDEGVSAHDWRLRAAHTSNGYRKPALLRYRFTVKAIRGVVTLSEFG
jgi:hypothetical protein